MAGAENTMDVEWVQIQQVRENHFPGRPLKRDIVSDEVGPFATQCTCLLLSLSVMSSTTFGPNYANRSTMTYSRLALEMDPYYVGPIPVLAFLDSFMPPPSAGSPPSGSPLFKPWNVR